MAQITRALETGHMQHRDEHYGPAEEGATGLVQMPTEYAVSCKLPFG